MARTAVAITQLFVILLCHLLVACGGAEAQQKEPEAESRADPAVAEDGTGPLTADGALRMAIAAAEAMETGDAKSRLATVEQIKDLLEKAADLDPPSPWISYVRTYVHVASGRTGDAITDIESFLDTRDGRNYWRAHRLLGDLLVNRYPRLANASYETAARLKNDEASVHYGLARCAASRGERDTAIEHLTQAIVADKNDTIAYTHFLAQVFQKKGQWDQAVRTAEQAVAMAERKLEQGKDRRSALFQIDAELELAMECAAGLIRAQPDNELGYTLSARLLHKRADYAAAASKLDEVQILRGGVERLGENASVNLLKAYANGLAETNQLAEAIAAYEKLLLKDPASIYASDQIARLRPMLETADPTENESQTRAP